MSNKNMFQSASVSAATPIADTRNLAGGKAYSLSAKEALAQYASCGTFNGTFYADPKDQIDELHSLLKKVEPEFVAKLAIYSRERAWMKDMPAFLVAYLAATDISFAKLAFARSIDNGRMIRNFAQMIRSGKLGRKSFGSAMKKAIEAWFDANTDERIFAASIGNDPSLADVIKMVHPRPSTPSRAALYAYLIGKKHNASDLPEIVKNFEAFKANPTKDNVPVIDFQFLTSMNLNKEIWMKVAENASWHNARMNINTFARHEALKDRDTVLNLAIKLSDPNTIRRSKAFPYQLLVTYLNMDSSQALDPIKKALHDAMEVSVENVPSFGDLKIQVGLDVSGSMAYPITGRTSVATKIRYIDVAALLASVIKRRGSNVSTYKFDTKCTEAPVDSSDTIITNTVKLSHLKGGTDCSSFVRKLNSENLSGDVLVIISDNMSWVDFYGNGRGETSLQKEWALFKKNNPNAKMVLLDVSPNATTQGSHKDILNIAGWNDRLFTVVADFINGKAGSDAWIKEIESITL